jgi:hypothetical protein
MTITGKQTKFGIEAYFLVPKKKLLRFVPEGLSLDTKLGLGTVVIGAWNHSNAYVDDKSYGPVLEAWLAIGVLYQGKQYGYVRTTYNNSPSYAEPVNNIFKFTKIQADLVWRERNGMQEVEVKQDEKVIVRFSGRPTFIPKTVPFSKPRFCWLIKGDEQFVADMTISPRKSRLASTSIYIPDGSPWEDLADIVNSRIKYSVFYEDASIKIPAPIKV